MFIEWIWKVLEHVLPLYLGWCSLLQYTQVLALTHPLQSKLYSSFSLQLESPLQVLQLQCRHPYLRFSKTRRSSYYFLNICLPGQTVSPIGTKHHLLPLPVPTTTLDTQQAPNHCLFNKWTNKGVSGQLYFWVPQSQDFHLWPNTGISTQDQEEWGKRSARGTKFKKGLT